MWDAFSTDSSPAPQPGRLVSQSTPGNSCLSEESKGCGQNESVRRHRSIETVRRPFAVAADREGTTHQGQWW